MHSSIGSITNTASNIGHQSWNGISSFLKSPSLQFSDKRTYDDLSTPNTDEHRFVS